jgi:hypothetical protein
MNVKIALLTKEKRTKHIKHCLLIFVVASFTVVLVWFFLSPRNSTDTVLYQKFCRQNFDVLQEKYSHFPESIPTGAENVKFHSYRWLGEGSMELEYKTNPSEIQALDESYHLQAICILEDGRKDYSLKDIQKTCGWNFWLDLGDGKDYLDQLEVIVLDVIVEPDTLSDHCDVTGIAFDKTNSIVLYWAKAYWCPDDGVTYPLYPSFHWDDQ